MTFKHMNPTKLELAVRGHEMRIKQEDMAQYRNGLYTLRATYTAIARALTKNSKAEYFDKPILYDVDSEEKPIELTEEQKIKRVEEFFKQLDQTYKGEGIDDRK